MKVIKSTPKKDLFYMPGEFETHKSCWILWPERPDNWRLNAKPAQKIFAETAKAIAQFEEVRVGVSKKQYPNARKMLPNYIKVVEIPNDDSWVRDSGPDFVINSNKEIRGVNWDFNAYGYTLYPSCKRDKMVAKNIIKFEGVDYYKANMVLEGGSVCVDGEGTLITTEECLLNTNRNSNLSKKQIEQYLKKYLNIKKIIWLKFGMYMDEAGGHIDNLCCFVRPGALVILWTDDKKDPQYKISQNAYKILKSSLDAKGRRFKIYKIHQPNSKHITKSESNGVRKANGVAPRKEGDKLPASYINFYIANGGIILPVFDDYYDKSAFETIKKIFPKHKVVKIYSREIILGGGGIHCITKQVPEAKYS